MQNLTPFLPYIWIGFAVIMAVCEAATAQLVSVWFVIGALCAAVSTIFTGSLIIQSLVFLFVSLVALIVTKPIVRKIKQNNQKVNTNSDRLVGQTGVVLHDIEDSQSIGQVKVMGEIWSARSDFAPIRKNTKIKVLAIEGVKLLVEQAQ
ncbi:MAG: NfeD family protein [Ruminococcus sp.]|nr:NfeD family protein [Ruminococcus sp.]